MHEHSLIANLLHKITEIARAQQARHVMTVNVRLGALAHISAEHLREHFVAAVRVRDLAGQCRT